MIFFFKLLLLVFLTLYLPGYLLNLVAFRGKRFDLLESIPYAFGSSLAIICVTAILTFIFHSDISIFLVLFLVVNIFLIFIATVNIQKKRITSFINIVFVNDSAEKYIAYPALFFLAVIFLMGFAIEMPKVLGQEDKVMLIMAERIKNLPSLHINNLLFKPGDVLVYFIPLYSYILAVLSKLSGIEIVQIYVKLRFVFSLIALSVTYAITRSLFPKLKELPWLVILVALSSMWSGWGINFASASVGQFFPFSLYQDFALWVVLPVCFLFYFRGLTDGWNYSVIALLLTVSLLFIHAREAIILLFLYSFAVLATLLSNRNRNVLIRGIFVIAGVLIAGIIVKALQTSLIDHRILAWGNELKTPLAEKISSIFNNSNFMDLFYPPLENESQYIPSFNLFYENPFYLLPVFLTPLMFYLRKESGLSALASPIYPAVAISSVPLINLLVIKYSYFQMLFGGPATFGLFPFSYIASGVFIWVLLSYINIHFGKIKHLYASLVALSFIAIPFLVHIPQWFYRLSPGLFYAWFLIGSPALIVLSFYKQPDYQLFGKSLLTRDNYMLIPFLLIFLFYASSKDYQAILKLTPDFERRPTSAGIAPVPFSSQYNQAKHSVSVLNWEKWYEDSTLQSPPLHVVEFIRRNIPEGRVFAAPVADLYNIPVFTNNFVYTSGAFISMVESVFFEKLYYFRFNDSVTKLMREDAFRHKYLKERDPHTLKEHRSTQYYLAMVLYFDDIMSKYQPIYNRLDKPEVTLELVRLFNIEYIYVTPEWYTHLKEVFASLSQHFEKIYEKDNYMVYKVRY